MAPEKTLLTIWIDLFGLCLVPAAVLPYVWSRWSILYLALLAFAVPTAVTLAFHLSRTLDNRRMDRENESMHQSTGKV